MDSSKTARGALKGVFQLSVGTTVTRLISAGSQFVLAIWLVPAQFGLWAAAISATAFAVALTNFGLVDGYLARRGLTLRSLLKQSTIGNVLLTLPVLAIAALYSRSGNHEVGLLVLLAGCNIPLTGLSEVLNARRLRRNGYRSIVLSQACAAFAKLGVGVAVAYATHSAVAIALSAIAFSVVMILLLLLPSSSREVVVDEPEYRPQERIAWATHALVMRLPPYLGFLVAQFLTTPDVLGMYYLSYQAVVAVSSVVAPPLKRVALNTMTQHPPEVKTMLARTFSHIASRATLTASAGAVVVLPLVWHLAPTHWRDALPAMLVFLALLPGRMLSPVIDAYQQASDEWNKSIRFHVFDGIVVCLAAITALMDDIFLLALVLSVSRLGVIGVRTYFAYVMPKRERWSLTAVSTGLPFALIVSAAVRDVTPVPSLTCFAIGAFLLGSAVVPLLRGDSPTAA
ncbi:oligosaccharide flippase family protein [Georgenia sp. MJ173]|uniref:oligosaccharide flippase family protein n=1 Tax=Georgenia sunbinii TaxID=3117728 RepID=UPI002F26C7A5